MASEALHAAWPGPHNPPDASTLLSPKLNFGELRKGEVRRIPLRNCLENSLRHLERASVATRCTRMGTPSTLLGRSRTPIRDLSRISKQFQKVNSQKFALLQALRPACHRK